MRPTAIIITIGSEILLGELVDTNAAWLSRALVDLGIEPVAHKTVGDSQKPLARTLEEALGAADLVVATGGLGPTADDTTRQAAAEATGRPLELRSDLLEAISRRLASHGRAVGENNRRQALVPEGATTLPNPVGTAPGFLVEMEAGPVLVCLPGVPFELERVWLSEVEPILRRRFACQGTLAIRVLKCVGAGESEVDRLLGQLAAGTATASLAFQLVGGEIHLRLVGQGSDEESARASLEPLEAEVRSRLGRLIYGQDGDTLSAVLLGRLRELGERLAALEVSTGGALLSALAEADPAGAVFAGGRLVPASSLRKDFPAGGTEEDREEEARALARRTAKEAGAGFGIALTGALESRGAEAAATYWMAASWGGEERVRLVRTSGPKELIHRRAALGALDVARRLAHGWPETGP